MRRSWSRLGEAAPQYPETLVNVAKLAFTRRPALSLRLIGVVESKSALTSRIQHILNRPLPKSRPARRGGFGRDCHHRRDPPADGRRAEYDRFRGH